MQGHLPDKKFSENLEALRGYAALFVVFYHLHLLVGVFSPFYDPKLLNLLAPDGHLWVLVFFVLSGYVIAANNPLNLKNETIGLFLKKRFTRIYPIYFIAIVLTLLVSIGFTRYGFVQILMNFALLQVLVVAPLNENEPTWSLNYEVLYYVLFVPLSRFKLNPIFVFVVSLVVALGAYAFYPNLHAPVISSYMFGFLFWIAGLCIARYANAEEQNTNYAGLAAALFMLMAANEILPRSGFATVTDKVAYVISGHHLLYTQVNIISQTYNSYRDLLFLPFCVYAVIIFSGKTFAYLRFLYVFLQVLLLAAVMFTAYNFFIAGKKSEPILHFIVSIAYYLVSVGLPLLNRGFIKTVCQKILKFGAWLGGISYAIYIVHFPLIFAMGYIHFLNHGLACYALRFLVFTLVLIGFSYLLERKLQPTIKKLVIIRQKLL